MDLTRCLHPQVEGAEEEDGDGAPEGTEVDFALIFYNAAVSGGSWSEGGRGMGRSLGTGGHRG